MFLLTVSENGQPVINNEIVLDQREMTIPLDTSKPFKLNAGTVGVCESLTWLAGSIMPLNERPVYCNRPCPLSYGDFE